MVGSDMEKILEEELPERFGGSVLDYQMIEEEDRASGHGASSRRILSITRSEISRLENLVTDFLSYARPTSVRAWPRSWRTWNASAAPTTWSC